MSADPIELIGSLQEIREIKHLSWRHRATLAWCIGKLMKEVSTNEEGYSQQQNVA